MGVNDGDAEVDAVTAWKIADVIDQTVKKMGPKDRLLLDLSITDAPGNPARHQDRRRFEGRLLGWSRLAEGVW